MWYNAAASTDASILWKTLTHFENTFPEGWFRVRSIAELIVSKLFMKRIPAPKGFYSQYGQDAYVLDLLGGMRGGVFVDVGAYDGVELSNTYHMEKELGWTGLAVEPHPAVFDELRRNRTCTLFHGCVGAANGTVRFRAVEGAASAMSGIEDAYNDRTLRRIERSGKHSDFIDVESVTLKDLLRRFGIDHVDFLSIDTEGSEYEILEAFDFSVPIRAITVENNMHTVPIRRLLERHGFALKATIECDSVYLRKE